MNAAKQNRDNDGGGDQVAYLVVREGRKWRDVFRLTPGQVTTIGRAPTNRVVLRDEVCSRNHCEVFRSGSSWILRDLGSRNGTLVAGQRISGDWTLDDGQLIRIGTSDLGFTRDLSRRFPELPPEEEPEVPEGDTAYELIFDEPPSAEAEPAIIHRTRQNRYHAPPAGESLNRDRASRELARLYQLALEMGAARNAQVLSEVVLEGLFAGTNADIGAVLMLPEEQSAPARSDDLFVTAYKTQADLPYQRVSDHLSRVVLEGSEAVLARDVADDSRLASRDSLGEIHAQSVICAPIRTEAAVLGLIHLYSTNPDSPLDPDDLEFTLAVADQFAVALENLKEKETLADGLARAETENQSLRRRLELENKLVGDHPSMHELRESIARIAPTDATVLIRGESGVGKELVARGIHVGSDRRGGAFVTMNCAALSESLLESELFGHEKGSFTGAVDRKPGKFEQADGGTLFLDEVGEMSQAVQAKFLRVLEGHPFERVGGRANVEVDVRVVAATNRDLEVAVREGNFRKDLYFRLHVVEMVVPALRERMSDVPLLANFFRERFARKTRRPIKGFAREALDALMAHDWPGNIRQLQNTVERAVILCAGELVQADDIRLSTLGVESSGAVEPPAGEEEYRQVPLAVLEQRHILATLEQTNWNKSRAAQILGIERSTLDRKLKRYEVSRPRELP
ncbi:MAG: sigma 54-interacting transcriptional regulator [Planctomycetaceae bacterium]